MISMYTILEFLKIPENDDSHFAVEHRKTENYLCRVSTHSYSKLV
jgi:hypothetical protein